MKRTPRHTLLRTAAALSLLLPALTACTIVSRTVPAADEPITFASFLPDVTKAGVVESAGDMTVFAVWGWHTDADAGATPTTIFNGERIYRDGTGATAPWTYDVPRFWVEGHYDFYALHPFPFTGADGSEVTAACTDGTGLTIDFSSPAADIDLMTAAATRTYSAANPASADAVPLDFGHLLARVSIVVSTQGGEITINSLKFSGMHLAGTCSYTPAAASAADQVKWTVDDGAQDGTGLFTLVSDDEALSGERTYADLLLIPGQDPSASTVNLVYTVGSSKAETVSMNLPAAPLWECGKRYTYTITVKPGSAELNIHVNEWNEFGDYSDDYPVRW